MFRYTTIELIYHFIRGSKTGFFEYMKVKFSGNWHQTCSLAVECSVTTNYYCQRGFICDIVIVQPPMSSARAEIDWSLEKSVNNVYDISIARRIKDEGAK